MTQQPMTADAAVRTRSMRVVFTNLPPAEPLTNFPALVVLGNHIPGFYYDTFGSSQGADLYFTDPSGTQPLNFEIEKWNPGGLSYVWVQVPVLTNGASVLASWGASGVTAPACTTNGATWSEGFKAVWHLSSTNDSTANGHHMQLIGPTPTQTAGVVADAYSFAYGTNASTADGMVHSNLNWTPTAYTISWWVKLPNLWWYRPWLGDTWGTFLSHSDFDVGKMYIGTDAGTRFVPADFANPVLTTYQWNHLTFIFNNGAARVMKNGVTVASKTGMTLPALWNVLYVWYPSQDFFAPFTGEVDEVQLSAVARSTNWIMASYLSMASNSTVTTYEPVRADFSRWGCVVEITLTNYPVPVGEALTNFPVLVLLSTNISNFSYGQFSSPVGADLRFVDANRCELPYEIERWDINGTSTVWVQVPVLTNGTCLRAYWQRDDVTAPAYTTNGATWSEGFKAVWHLSSTNDSTANRHNLIVQGNAGPSPVACPVAGGYCGDLYDGIVRTYNLNWTAQSYTVSWWVRPPTWSARIPIIGCLNGVRFLAVSDWDVGKMFAGNIWANFLMTSEPVLTIDQWVHLTFTFDGSSNTAAWYKSGQFLNSGTIPAPNWWADNVFYITRPNWEGFLGTSTNHVDEVQVSNVARSPNWIKATYLSMASNSTVVVFGKVTEKPKGTLMLIQ